MDELSKDIVERLRRLDPVTDLSYHHADTDAMVARITAAPRAPRVRFAPGFRLRMGSAVAAAALVSAVAITAIDAGAPSLSFALSGAANTAPTTSRFSATVPTSETMKPAATFDFVAGPSLSSSTGTAESYSIAAPTDLTTTSTDIAAALGTVGTTSGTPATGQSWTIDLGSSSTVSFSATGASLTWSFDASEPVTGVVSAPGSTSSSSGDGAASTGSTSTSSPTPSDAQTATWAQQLSSRLGVADQLSDPQFSLDNAGAGASGDGPNTVTYAWTPNGVATGLTYDFSFDGQGQLLSADGETGTVTELGVVSTISEVAAVTVLQQEWTDNSPLVSGDPTPFYSPQDGTVPTVAITLVSAVTSYAPYTLVDGQDALLPQYTFTDSTGGTWSVLAVDPSLVSLSSSGSVGPVYN